MDIGEKVKLKSCPEVTGIITDKRQARRKVKYDGNKWVPPEDWYYWSDLEYLDANTEPPQSLYSWKKKECTCGAKFDRNFPDAHMLYCDLYEKET